MQNIELKQINIAEAQRYMGYRNTQPDDNARQMIAECEGELLKLIEPRYVYRVFDIAFHKDFVEVCDTSLRLTGNDINKHLAGCEKCVLMCCTVSSGADVLIRRYQASDIAKALMTDCLASAAVEQVCDIAENDINNACEGYYFTWRFSAGYGDLPIDIQREFIAVTNAQKRIGLSCTENNILVPTKSVTAIIGLSKNEITKGRRGCATCKMNKTCEYRKGGKHCGF